MGKSSSAKTQITEYRMSLHVGVGIKLDAVTEIRVDEKVAWSGDVTTNTALNINRPDLFGGEKKEGGLVGTVQVLLGGDTQVAPAAVAARYGRTPTTCPGFRGYTSLFFHGSGVVSTGRPNEWDDYWADPGSYYYGNGGFLWKTNSPVIAQKIEVTGRRAPKGLDPANAMIGPDANPIHMIYECLVNDEWGMAGAPELIDTARWNAEALRIKNEAFGLTVWWMRQSEIEAFVSEILDHIQATLFFNPNTGLLDITLLRGDYDLENLRVITPNNATLSNFKRRSSGEVVNEISVEWTNPANEDGESITAQDIASIESQGGQRVSGTRNYYMVRSRELATKLLERDLRASTAPLASVEASLDRSAWDLLPGEVVRLQWPRRSDYEMVMRVGRVSQGKPTDSKIKASLLQDVYSLEMPPIRILPPTEWADSSADPAPLAMQLFTVPAYFVRNAEIQNVSVTLEDGDVLVGALADSQTYDSLDYELVSESAAADGSLVTTSKGALSLTPQALLQDAVVAQSTTLLPVELFPVLDEAPRLGGFVFIGYGDANQEIALVTSRSEDGWTVSRGVLDTTPKAWSAGTPVWVVNPGARIVDSQTVHAADVEVGYRGLDRTSRGSLALDDAPLVEMTTTNRPHLPLRPANVKVNGVGFGSVNVSAASTIEITWATRNRDFEDAVALAWTDGPVTPEYRQETVIQVYDAASDTLIVEYPYMWLETSRTFPKSSFDRYASVRFTVLSRRDDLESLQGHSVTVTGLANNPAAPPPPGAGQRDEPPSFIPAPGGWMVSDTGGIIGDDGNTLPAVIVTGQQDNPAATHLIVRLTLHAAPTLPGDEPGSAIGSSTISSPFVLNRETQTFSLSSGVASGSWYRVAVAYVVDGVIGLDADLGWVTTASLTSGVSSEDPIWGEVSNQAARILRTAIEGAQAVLDEEVRRATETVDLRDRLGLGMLLDPVTGEAMILPAMKAKGVGPGGLDETLIQTATRLAAADAANQAYSALVLSQAIAHADDIAAYSALTYATQSALASGLSATLLSAQSYTDALESWANLTLATKAERSSGDAATLISAQSYADAAAASAIIGLATTSAMNAAIASSAATLQTWTNGQIAAAVSGLVSTATLASSLATAQGQWEAYATAAAASAVVGLVSAATLATSLATAQGQWESYADDASANAIIGLDTVAAREAAVAASALSLQSWVAAGYATSSALLAVSTTLGTTTSTAYLALSTAQGNEAYAALMVDAYDRLTGLRVNGVNRAIDFLADYFSVVPGSGGDGIYFDGPNGRFKVVKSGRKVVLAAGSNLILWAGSTSVSDGSEVYDNGILGIGSAGAWFGGQTLSGPFDSGDTAASLALSGSWQDAAVATKGVLAGYFLSWPMLTTQGVGTYDSGAGVYRLTIEWRVISTDAGGGDVEVIESGSIGRTNPSSGSFAALGYAPERRPGQSQPGTKSGTRRLVLQARFTAGSSAAVTNRRLAGFYAT